MEIGRGEIAQVLYQNVNIRGTNYESSNKIHSLK